MTIIRATVAIDTKSRCCTRESLNVRGKRGFKKFEKCNDEEDASRNDPDNIWISAPAPSPPPLSD